MRYLRLYLNFVRFSFSKAMEFRLDFFFRFFMDCVFYAVNIAFYYLLFQHTSSLGGWRFDQVLVFAGGVFAIDALVMTLFSTNLWNLPFAINKGELDYHLTRPVSSLFFLTTREFAANSFMNMVVACGYWIWAIAHLQQEVSAAQVILYILLVLNGAFLFFLLHLIAILPVFWTGSPRGLAGIFWTLESFMERPHRIYAGWLRWILVTILPFSLMSSVPAEILFDGIRLEIIINAVAVTAVLFAFTLWLWGRGLRNYSSASS